MLLRGYSILGTLLLALCVASPAFAAGKGKKKAHQDSADSSASDDEKAADKAADTADEKPARGAKAAKAAKKKKAKKGDAKSDDKKAADKSDDKSVDKAMSDAEGHPDPDAPAATAATTETEMPDPNVWEKPPEEKEKPKPVEVAPVAEVKGDGRPWSAGIAAGWGMKTDRRTGGFGADPYTFGAGLRGGYEFDFKLYVGLWFNWYLGSSETGSAARIAIGESTTHANYWQFGADVGYDWWIASVIIRPSLELGEAIAVTDALGITKSIADFMIAPGLTVIYPWDNLFIGGEFRGNLVTGDGVSALLIAAQFGLRFED